MLVLKQRYSPRGPQGRASPLSCQRQLIAKGFAGDEIEHEVLEAFAFGDVGFDDGFEFFAFGVIGLATGGVGHELLREAEPELIDVCHQPLFEICDVLDFGAIGELP